MIDEEKLRMWMISVNNHLKDTDLIDEHTHVSLHERALDVIEEGENHE